ncbi:MAG: DUF2807 domain-containing protein [Parvularculaceae bacterium]
MIDKTKIIALALAGSAIVAPALAGDQPVLRIQNYLGVISIQTEKGAALKVQNTKQGANLDIISNDRNLTINGGFDEKRNVHCWQEDGDIYYSIGGKRWAKKQSQKLADQTKLEIIAPPNVRVEIDDSFYRGKIGNIGSGDISLNHCGDLEIGNITGPTQLRTHGAGHLTAGNIGAGEIGIYGSGDILVGATKDIEINLYGSGKIEAGAIGAADIKLYGSGDISFADAQGDLEATIYGSGNIRGQKVAGGLQSNSHGSGNIYLTSINGPVSIDIMGSTHIEIEAGRASAFEFEGRGSGSVKFGGVAVNPDVDIRHSSSHLTLGRVEGRLNARGQTKRIKILDQTGDGQ